MAFKKSYNYSKKTKVTTKAKRFIPDVGWNEQFENVFDFVVNGSGNGAVNAVAGSGKTTALVESAIRYSEKNPYKTICVIAYNVSIKEECEKRLAGYPITVLTCHGLGYRSLARPEAWGNPYGNQQFAVEGSKGQLMNDIVANEIGFEKEKFVDRDLLMELISYAKTCLANTEDEIIELMHRFGINPSYPPERFAKYAKKILDYTRYNPGTSFHNSKKVITFDDQVWLPVINNWEVTKYDAVFVDEAQDLSKTRRELIKKALRKDSRLFVFFDPYQAIYGFAGADIDSCFKLIDEFDCKVLPLSCTWRCSTEIVEKAKLFNKDIEAAPTATKGIVDECYKDQLESLIKSGDVILSRKNSPLIKLFFKLVKQKLTVEFIGKDYGQMLSYRINTWKSKYEYNNKPFTGNDLLNCNDLWLEKCKEYTGKATPRQKDEHETFIVLSEDLVNPLNTEASVGEIIKKCSMFSPDQKKNKKKDCITLSSVHRFKGLERDRAFILEDTFGVSTDENLSENPIEEESNLMYVAITRAKDHLTFVLKNQEKENE